MKYPDMEGDWLGLALGFARFENWHVPRDVQIRRAVGLGLTLGLTRFASVCLGLWMLNSTTEISNLFVPCTCL